MNYLAALVLLAMVSSVAFVSCDDEDLPPIGGYNSADEVGAADLMAYFPLDGNSKEDISGTAATTENNVTWGAGAKGQAAMLDSGYIAYPAITNLSTSMASITVSLWAKLDNNGGYPTLLFGLTRENEWAGNVNMLCETGWYAAGIDTMITKGLVVIKNEDGSANWQDSRNVANPTADDIANGAIAAPNKVGGTWAHFVITWDAATAMFKVYSNGQKISNPQWESRNGGSALDLNFFTPTRALIGTFESVVNGTPDGWQGKMTGSVDEIRVWKKALSAADINSLYELEKAGR